MPHLEYTDEELELRPGWDIDPDSQTPLSPRIREQLRRAVVVQHERRNLEAELAEYRRKDAFRELGIPADARGDLFVRANPDLTDPKDIKAAWEKAFGPLEGDGDGANGTDAADGAARRTVDAGASGAGAGSQPGDVDLADGMRKAFDEGGAAGLKAFIAEHGKFDKPIEIDGRLVHGLKLPDIY